MLRCCGLCVFFVGGLGVGCFGMVVGVYVGMYSSLLVCTNGM